MSINVKESIPLAPLTTFKIGGPAKYFVDVKTEKELREAILWAKEKSLSFVLLSGGSNILIPDEGLNKLVIHIIKGDYKFTDPLLTSDAGCNLLELIRTANIHGLGGWEKLAGIPGTIGGAIRGNAGAFGTEIKDFPVKVRALNSATAEIKEFGNADCDFSYRHSFFKDNPEWIITNIEIELNSIDKIAGSRLIGVTIAGREKRHLQNVRAAGSYFMNPVATDDVQKMFESEKGEPSRLGRVPAGWLIEKAGMKGAVVGGAMASLQHPNYIVNTGGATAADVLALADTIKRTVKEKFGVELKEEAVVLG
jgi:UDP-N-acetylmuramate dehydrogenase